MAALFGILGSAIGAGGVGVGIAAVNGAFGNFSLQDNADQLSPEEKAQVSSLSPNDRDARGTLFLLQGVWGGAEGKNFGAGQGDS